MTTSTKVRSSIWSLGTGAGEACGSIVAFKGGADELRSTLDSGGLVVTLSRSAFCFLESIHPPGLDERSLSK